MKKYVSSLFINSTCTIKEAMEVITDAGRQRLPVGIALIVDKKNRLIGTITDGDIRKALVKGIQLDEPVDQIMAKDPITVNESLSTDEMVMTMHEKVKLSGRISDTKVDKVIVTDKDNKVVDVIDFYELWYRQEVKYKKICVVGTGHVGLTLLVVLADLGYQAMGFDINEDLVRDLNKGKVSFFEKGLAPLLKFHLREKKINFVSSLDDEDADIYIISVGTPVDDKTNKPVNTAIKSAAKIIGKKLKKEDIVILRSTVTVGTTRNVVMPILEKESSLEAGADFYLAFAPERVVEGNALEELREIPQVVGGLNKKSVQEATRILQTINPSVIALDSLEASEIVKLINNSYRDYSFAFANKIATLCDSLKLDAVKIIKGSCEGYPRNPLPLPSPGVGGYCLTKDPYLMADVFRKYNIDPSIFLQSREINESMPELVGKKVIDFVENNLKQLKRVKIYLLGFAFKGYPETSDMRGSPTIDVINYLNKEAKFSLDICGYDPVVDPKRIQDLGVKYENFKNGFKDAHCCLIMNNHPDFAKMDVFSLLELMHKPGFLFDGWQLFQPQEIKRIEGIVYQGLGG